MKEIESYCLYYIPKHNEGLNDVLMIYFGENNPITERKLENELISFYNGPTIIGFAILNFSNHAKIKINGTIFLPNKYLLEIINNVLANAKKNIVLLEKPCSGFVVGKILEKEEGNRSYIYKVDINSDMINVESTYDIDIGLLVCIALENTYLLPARMIKKYETKNHKEIRGRICTYEDLQMEVQNAHLPLLMQEDELDVGQDFFLMEEKNNDGNRA